MTKLHTVYKFRQSQWLTKYVKYNADQRTKAKTNFQNLLHKLLNIASFGKLIQKIRKRNDFELINKTDTKKIKRQTKTMFKDKNGEYEKYNIH